MQRHAQPTSTVTLVDFCRKNGLNTISVIQKLAQNNITAGYDTVITATIYAAVVQIIADYITKPVGK